MASGSVVGSILQSIAPAASRATPGVRAGGSTPGENWPILSFDDTTDEYWDFLCALQGYDAGGLTVEIPWMAATATTGAVAWNVAIRRLADDAEDLDVSHTYDFNVITPTTASAAGELSYDTVTFTSGADMDSLADGERFMLRVFRDPDHGSDNLSGDAQILWPSIIIRET